MRRKGQSLLEILIAIGMIVFFATAFLGLIVSSYGRLDQSKDQSTAALLGAEGIRAVASIADHDWNALNCSLAPCAFGLVRKDGTYALEEKKPDTTGVTPQTVFTRTIETDHVWRDADGNIVPDTTKNAVPDSEARTVRVTVTWRNQVKRQTSAVFTSLVSRSHKTASVVFDTKEDFAGTSKTFAFPPSFHNVNVVQELVNGEVRTGTAGAFERAEAVTTLLTLTPSSSDDIVAMQRSEDLLFVATAEGLTVASLANISHGSVNIEKHLPISGGVTSLAVSDGAIFVGTADGRIVVIKRIRNPGFGITAIWDTLGQSPIRAMVMDEERHALLVGRDSGDGAEFMAMDTHSLTHPSIFKKQEIAGNVTALASDGAFAYIATQSNDVMIVSFDASTLSSHAFSPYDQHIIALVREGDTLFVLRAQDAQSPELTAWTIERHPEKFRADLFVKAEMEIDDIESTGTMMLLPEKERLVIAGGRNVHLVDTHLATMNTVRSPSGVTSGSCSASAFDEQHLFFACKENARNVLMTAIDPDMPTDFVPWGTYTSPITCVDPSVALRHWNTMKFRTSGQGFISLQLRAGPTVGDVQENPWIGPEGNEDFSFEDDTIWHDIDFLGGSRCIQARVEFHGLTTCPLALDHLLFTYE